MKINMVLNSDEIIGFISRGLKLNECEDAKYTVRLYPVSYDISAEVIVDIKSKLDYCTKCGAGRTRLDHAQNCSAAINDK